MYLAPNNAAAIANGKSRDATRRRRPSPRFSLRALFIAITVLAIGLGYVVWTVDLVQRRERLLQACVEHDAYIITSWEDAPGYPMFTSNIKDFRSADIHHMFDVWTKSPPDPSVVIVHPTDRRKLSPLRRWLGDRRVDNIFFTDVAPILVYRKAFPEALIVAYPAAKAAIADWERRTNSRLRRLTNPR
ncbi:MAG: hypothetical protein H0T51_27055 [Pirellulales bacterium]|nr:hypothetical protein [Pirellulales bacterium]